MKPDIRSEAEALHRAIDRFGYSDKRENDRAVLLERVAYSVAAILEHLAPTEAS